MLGAAVSLVCVTIIFNFDRLFDLVVTITTEYSQPVLGLFFCVFVAWIWKRDGVLQEIKEGYPEAESSLFWKIWPFYVKFICPLAIVMVYVELLT